MNDTSTISPASTNSRATSATRRMFSTRSASVKPRSRLRPWRTLSPSSDDGVLAEREQPLLDQVGDGGLAGARQAGEPQHRRLLAASAPRAPPCPRRAGASGCRSASRSARSTMPGADRVAGQPVDQDEAAHLAVVRVGLEGDRLRQRQSVTRPISLQMQLACAGTSVSVSMSSRWAMSVTVAVTVRQPSGSR